MNRKSLNLRRRKSPMPNLIRALCLIAVAVLISQNAAHLPCAMADGQQENWKAGLASTVITPEQPMWMAGYAARTKPSEGKVHDLRAKALALEDAQGARVVIVTVDLLGISRTMRDWLEKEVGQRYKLPPEGLLLSASHTHCGPAVREAKYSVYGDNFYGLSAEEVQQSERYAEDLQQKLLQLVGQAMEDLAPARLSYSHARAGFAMNRRSKVRRVIRFSRTRTVPLTTMSPSCASIAPTANCGPCCSGMPATALRWISISSAATMPASPRST